MTLVVLGINHKTAELDIREQVAFDPATIHNALHNLSSFCNAKSVIILSTCNRSELYLEFNQIDLNIDYKNIILNWISDYFKFNLERLNKASYYHTNLDAIKHMMRVACGLDSMIIGEPQILGQMKLAVKYAKQANTLHANLERAFNATFSCAKQVRTQTDIGENPISIAFAAVNLAKQIFSDLKTSCALLIGAGETINLVAKYLYQAGVTNITVANRTYERAYDLAQNFNAKCALLEEIPHLLMHNDIVISSTASPLPILGKGAVEKALTMRKQQPIFMLDLAVPRDIEVQVGDLTNVHLYNVDDLHQTIAQNLTLRQSAAQQAHAIIAGHAHNFMDLTRERIAQNLLCAFRAQAQIVSDEQIKQALRELNNGMQAERVLNKLAHNLTNKLIHAPTLGLKTLAREFGDEHLDFAAILLGINKI